MAGSFKFWNKKKKNTCNCEDSNKLMSVLEERRKKQEELVRKLAEEENEQQAALSAALKHQRAQQSLAISLVHQDESSLDQVLSKKEARNSELVQDIVRQEESQQAAIRELLHRGEAKVTLDETHETLGKVLSCQEARKSELVQNIVRQEESQQAAIRELLHRGEAHNAELQRAVLKEEEAQRSQLSSLLSSVSDKSAPLIQLVLDDQQLQRSILGLVRARQHDQQGQLTSCVESEHQLQQAALAALREKSDVKCRDIAEQVAIVQRQLAQLTALELNKKHHQNQQILNEVSSERERICATLSSLVQQQDSRRRHLLDEVCSQLGEADETLWLVQLERLLKSAPSSLAAKVKDLAAALPLSTLAATPSAPLLSPEEPSSKEDLFAPSAPLLATDDLECAICMDAKCGTVFLPCGHVCSCEKCSELLGQCPLCRQEITHKVPWQQTWWRTT